METENDIIDLDDNMTGGQNLPNSTTVLVLGIISIVGAFCYGIPGLVCGIIALVLGKKDKELYNANPKKYSEASYKNLNAGHICGIIGTILSALFFVFIIFYFIFAFSVMNAAIDHSNDDLWREILENSN